MLANKPTEDGYAIQPDLNEFSLKEMLISHLFRTLIVANICFTFSRHLVPYYKTYHESGMRPNQERLLGYALEGRRYFSVDGQS